MLAAHAPSLLELPCLSSSETRLASALLYGFEVPRQLYQLGATRVFFRAGGAAALDEMRYCDMSERAPRLVARVRRWVALRRWRLAIAHTRLGLRFLKLHRSVLATRRWLFATRVLRVYARGFRRLHRRLVSNARATVIQAAARAMAPRRAFLIHAAALYAARRAAAQAALEAEAAAHLQALLRGAVARRAYRRELAELAAAKAQPPAATYIQRLFRGARSRREHARLVRSDTPSLTRQPTRLSSRILAPPHAPPSAARQVRELLERMVPAAASLQRWWRVVAGEKTLRKLRSVVDRYVEEHVGLMKELVEMKTKLDQDAEARAGAAARPAGPPPRGGKRFEMWITLRVGLSVGLASPEVSLQRPSAPAGRSIRRSIRRRVGVPRSAPSAHAAYNIGRSMWQEHHEGTEQIHSVRAATLRAAGIYFRDRFGDPANVDVDRDEEGHYLVRRPSRHFGSILEYMRDGACALPEGYVPATFDARKATTEASVNPRLPRPRGCSPHLRSSHPIWQEYELRLFVREAGFYGLSELVERARGRLLALRYGGNPVMLGLMKDKGLLP